MQCSTPSQQIIPLLLQNAYSRNSYKKKWGVSFIFRFGCCFDMFLMYFSEVLLPNGRSLGLPLIEDNSALECNNVIYFILQKNILKTLSSTRGCLVLF